MTDVTMRQMTRGEWLAKEALRQRVDMLARQLKAWERAFLREKIEEHMGPLSEWPLIKAEMLLSRHLNNSQRMQLTYFMLGNGCQPDVYAQWITLRGMLRDKSARDSIVYILEAHKTGKLEGAGKQTWCMRATLPNGDAPRGMDKVRKVKTPHFAFDWQHQHYWDDAIAIVKNGTSATSPVPFQPSPLMNPQLPTDKFSTVSIAGPSDAP